MCCGVLCLVLAVTLAFLLGCRAGWHLCHKAEGNVLLRTLLTQPRTALSFLWLLVRHVLAPSAKHYEPADADESGSESGSGSGSGKKNGSEPAEYTPGDPGGGGPRREAQLAIKSTQGKGSYMVIRYAYNYLPYRMVLSMGTPGCAWDTDELEHGAAHSLVTELLDGMSAANKIYSVVSGFRPLDDLLTEAFGPRAALPQDTEIPDLVAHIHEQMVVPPHVRSATLHGTSVSYTLDLDNYTLEAVPCGPVPADADAAPEPPAPANEARANEAPADEATPMEF